MVKLPLAGSSPEGGLKAQESPVGKFGQLSENWSVKPFREVSTILKVDELPMDTVAESGVTDPIAFST
jgi:hypothetical protein